MKHIKYFGFTFGKILDGFSILPSINVNWAEMNGRYYDVQFAWLWWYFTAGEIDKRLKEYWP